MIIAKSLPLVFSLLAFSAYAGEPTTADLDLEPCINGEVSASGTFPSHAMEDQIHAYIAWSAKTGHPYYLFRVASERLAVPYPQR